MNKLFIATLLFFMLQMGITAKEKVTPRLYQKVNKKEMNRWVDSVFNKMTMDERIGQLFFVVATGDNTQANKTTIQNNVKNLHLGGILFSKGNPVDQAVLTNTAQKAAKIPLMVTLDGEWGLSMRLSNTTRFPYNIMLGAIQNDSLLYYYGLEVARQCKLMGIHVNFAPDIDVNSNPNNPVIGYRSFGENPKRVAQFGIMYAKGLEAGGVMAVSKHFPGHGDTSTDSHHTLPLVDHDRRRLDEVELYPFAQYIDARLSGLMIGHLNVPALDKSGQPSSLSESIGTQLLQKELGFSGLIFTDGLQMKGVANEPNFCVRALKAGNDILLGPINIVKEYKNVQKAVEEKFLSDTLINQKCRKVLEYKYVLGIHNQKEIETKNLVSNLNSSYPEWINRRMNEASMTLLKNEQDILPLKKLDERQIAAVSIGGSANNAFHRTLKKYDKVTCFNVADGNGLNGLRSTLDKYNTIIISVHSTKVAPDAAIASLSLKKNVIVSFFINPYKTDGYNATVKRSDAVLLAYETTNLAQEYAAQALFGGNDVNGKIPVSVKGLFEEGEGLKIEKTRLSYGMPEDVGIRSSDLDSIRTIVQEGINAKAFPGCQVLVAKDGVVIYERSFGTFEYDKKREVEDDDIYDIASMTKATATVPALMKLYDKKKISLNDNLSQFVPALKATDKATITIREALYHESRLPAMIPYYMSAIDKNSYEGRMFERRRTEVHTKQFDETTWARTDYQFLPGMVSTRPRDGFLPVADNLYINKMYKDSIISNIAGSRLNRRKGYLYSCLNFILLKEAIEKGAGTDLSSFLQSNFYERLGATTTTYNPLDKFDREMIVPTERDLFLRKQLLRGYVHDEGAAFLGGISGNAGLFSNANDLAKLYQMLLNKGTYGGESYLSQKTCVLFSSSRSSISRRGLGFDRPEMDTRKSSPTSYSTPRSTYGHTGFTGTSFWIDPDNNLIFIFLSNRVNESRTHKQINSLGIRPRLQEEVYRAIRRSKSNKILPAIKK